MTTVEDVYNDLSIDIDFEEFRSEVEQKVEEMGGLVDEDAAAVLISEKLEDYTQTIADIEAEWAQAKFVGKAISIGSVNSFSRDDGSEGKVANLELADESGQITTTFWNDMAEEVVEATEVGDCLDIGGRPKDGYNGLEVNVDHFERNDSATIDIQVKDQYTVEELTPGLSNVTLSAVVLNASDVRTFTRNGGSQGRVSNLTIGDNTGRSRVTLWDDKANISEHFSAGDGIVIEDGTVQENDGKAEVHIGSEGTIQAADEDIEYSPPTTDIQEVDIDQVVDLEGGVIEKEDKRTFDRDDGSEGKVRNITLKDQTGTIRVALWGEMADTDIGVADKIVLTEVEIREGWQGGLEASAGWQSGLSITEKGGADVELEADDGPEEPDSDDDSRDRPTGLSDYGGDEPADDEESSSDGGASEDSQVEIAGMVVGTGDEITIDTDTGPQKVHYDGDAGLGETVVARGTMKDGVLEATEII